jgi:hypothetical protein
MAELADHAYGHALAVVGNDAPAIEVARRGLLRGGRSRVAVLGHTRAAALAGDVPADGASPMGAPTTVTEAALALAWRRPPLERAVVDLDGRHGLTRGGFSRALGLSPAEAADRVNAVAQAWSAELDPALLAWMGPGDCPELAELLGPSPLDVDALVTAAPAVTAHTEECELCRDRRRAMISVRSVLGQLPLPKAPRALNSPARTARRRPPVPPPALGRERGRTWVRGVVWAAAAVAVALAGLGVSQLVDGDGNVRKNRVDALTALPSGAGSLDVSQNTFDAKTGSVVLNNLSTKPLRWEASATVPWVRTVPDRGELPPHGSVMVNLRISDTAPEGDMAATVSFSGDDGSTASVAGAGSLERPPDVAAHRDGCLVLATAEDDGPVTAVTLRWWEGTLSYQVAMAASPEGYRGTLSPNATRWWVTAKDARGNESRTMEESVTPPAC